MLGMSRGNESRAVRSLFPKCLVAYCPRCKFSYVVLTKMGGTKIEKGPPSDVPRATHGKRRTVIRAPDFCVQLIASSMGASQSKADNEQVFYNPVPIQVSE